MFTQGITNSQSYITKKTPEQDSNCTELGESSKFKSHNQDNSGLPWTSSIPLISSLFKYRNYNNHEINQNKTEPENKINLGDDLFDNNKNKKNSNSNNFQLMEQKFFSDWAEKSNALQKETQELIDKSELTIAKSKSLLVNSDQTIKEFNAAAEKFKASIHSLNTTINRINRSLFSDIISILNNFISYIKSFFKKSQ